MCSRVYYAIQTSSRMHVGRAHGQISRSIRVGRGRSAWEDMERHGVVGASYEYRRIEGWFGQGLAKAP